MKFTIDNPRTYTTRDTADIQHTIDYLNCFFHSINYYEARGVGGGGVSVYSVVADWCGGGQLSANAPSCP